MLQWKKEKQKGFTVTEMLVVVLITVVLLAISIVGAVTYMRHLQLKELDNAAKEIFLSAQNRASLLNGGQRLERYVVQENADNRIEHVDIIPGSGETTQITAYYKHLTSADMQELLPKDTIEPSLWDGDFYIIYEPTSGSVVDVFFNKRGLPIEENFPAFYEKWRAAPKEQRMASKPMIGYYGGEPAASGTALSLRTPVINIYNENTLRAEVTYWVPRTLAMINEANNVKMKTTLNYQGKQLVLDPADADKKQEPGLAQLAYTYTWTLDSLGEIRFKKLFESLDNTLVYGKDFSINAEVYYTGSKLTVNGANKTAEDNSLFAKGSGEETAYVEYMRHLQNLDTEFSGVDQKQSGVQQGDILEVKDYFFKPIQNTKLQDYDGNRFLIEGLHIRETAANAAGLFGVFEGTENARKKLKDIRLVGTTVSAETGFAGALIGTGNYLDITNCQVYWENKSSQSTNLREILGDSTNGFNYQIVGRGTTGGLAGVLNNTKVERCSASTLVQSTAAVGGLIGEASNLTLNQSYSASYLNSPLAAGLIGNTTGTADVSGSYAVGFIDSGDSAAQAAGLSMGTGTANVTASYSAMLFSVGENAVNYPLSQTGTYKKTYYLDSDLFHFVPGNENRAKGYSDLIDPAKWERLFGEGVFTAKGAAKSHPYNLQTTLSLTTFVYPGVDKLEHWGDWGAQFQNGSLVYYECYQDGTYGFNGGGMNNLVSKPIIKDGYAVAYRSTEPIAGIGAVLNVTYGKAEKPKTERFAYGNGSQNEIYEITNVVDTTGEISNYYLLALPGKVVNIDYAGEHFYQKIVIEDVAENISKSYYYNPHFANTILPYEENLDLNQLANQLRAEIRTPRHLNMLSKFPTYYASNHQYRFLQTQNLDYNIYTGYDLFTKEWGQTPIGIDANSPFRGSYYGNTHTISGVRMKVVNDKGETYQYIGLFGYSTNMLRDVVYRMDDKSAYSVTHKGNGSAIPYLGGLVGYNGGTVDNCAVSGAEFRADCYSYSTIYLGGLVGLNEGTIRSSGVEVADISVDTNLSNAYVGGFAGRNAAGGIIEQSYAVGSVFASRARYGTVYASGFSSRNDATISRSYAAVSLLVEGGGESYGFSPDKSTKCVYLNDGNFTYRNRHYAAQYNDPYASAVNWEALAGKAYSDKVEELGMTTQGIDAFDSEQPYPYPGIVKNAAKEPIHYGQWPDRMDLGKMGVYYWEKMDDFYYFSVLSLDENQQVNTSSTLPTVHGDGKSVSEYGYGYFHEADTAKPVLHSRDIYWDDRVFNPAETPMNTAANKALSALMSGRYQFYSYHTWEAEQSQGLHLIVTEETQNNLQPPFGTWELTQGDARLEVKLNPFFGNSMAQGEGALPGEKDSPYEIRSIEQLHFINWNGSVKNTQTVLVKENAKQFPFLSYGIDEKLVQRSYHWKQTHDLDGKKKVYTPIAEFYDPDWSVKGGVLSGWFGGTYDGNDYIIADVNIHGQTSSCVGLFGAVFNGILKNIVLHSTDGTGTVIGSDSGTSQWYAIGGLAGLAGSTEGSAVSNCAVTGYTVQDTHQATKKGGWGGTGLGGLIGVCDMDMKGCTAVTNIKLDSRDNDNVRMGGLVGSCQGSISSSYAGGSITVAQTSSVFPKRGIYGGGIVGGIYMKPLKVGNRSDVTVGRSGQELQNTLNNCYSYVVLPDASSNQYIKGLYAVGGSGDLNKDRDHDDPGHYNSDHGWSNYNNNFYLALDVLQNNEGTIENIKTDIREEEVVGMTYGQMSDSTGSQGLLHRLNANGGGFATVTTRTVGGESIDGRYSFGSDRSLLGKNYPFPTILTQSSTVAPDGRANVHYGDWPLAGIRREQGALPMEMDLFADYRKEQKGAAKIETLRLAGVPSGGTWKVESKEPDIAQAVLEGSDADSRRLKVTALAQGSTIVTVTYTVDRQEYRLPIEVNVTAQLRLVAVGKSPVPMYIDEMAPSVEEAALPTARIPLELCDKNGRRLPQEIKLALSDFYVEFDSDYFTQAEIQNKTDFTLDAATAGKEGITQMTAGYTFEYLNKSYSSTSVLIFDVVKPDVLVDPLKFVFEKGSKKEQLQEYTGENGFTLTVDGTEKPITNLRITAFEEVVAEFKDLIWVDWQKNADGTPKEGTLSITAYPQNIYPTVAGVKVQFQFECDGNTYTQWQNLPIELIEKAEEAKP